MTDRSPGARNPEVTIPSQIATALLCSGCQAEALGTGRRFVRGELRARFDPEGRLLVHCPIHPGEIVKEFRVQLAPASVLTVSPAELSLSLLCRHCEERAFADGFLLEEQPLTIGFGEDGSLVLECPGHECTVNQFRVDPV